MAAGDKTEQVLGHIAGNLTALKGSAAFSHYPSLRIQTRNLNNALRDAVHSTRGINDDLKSALQQDSSIEPDLRDPANPLIHYRQIAPRIIANVLLVARKLLNETLPEPKLGIDEATRLRGSFDDFCDLCTSIRQFTDTIVENSYQLRALSPKYLNYKILESLTSFVVVAPSSLQSPIYSAELEKIVEEYAAMNAKGRKNSEFTDAANEQFPQRVAFLCRELRPAFHTHLEDNLNAVFKFSSDFAHIGYISTLVVGRDDGQVFLGGPGDVFTPRAENFAELKLQLLREAVTFYADIFLRSLNFFTCQFVTEGARGDIEARIAFEISKLLKAYQLTFRTLVEPIVKGLIGSNDVINFECNCGGSLEWALPHEHWDNYCNSCGARFEMHEVPPEIGYVISAQGPGDVTGSTATKIADLPTELRAKLKRIWERHKDSPAKEADVSFLHITDPENIDEVTLKTSSKVLRTPTPEEKKDCRIYAFVGNAALRSNTEVLIHCNCGNKIPWKRPFAANTLLCDRCRTTIGLMVVSGDPGYLRGRNPDGTAKLITVHGSRSKPAYLLTAAERDHILKSKPSDDQSSDASTAG